MSIQWFEAGRYIVDTGYDDPAWSGMVQGYTYAARARPIQMFRSGGFTNDVTYKWMVSARVAHSGEFYYPTNNQGNVWAGNTNRRIYIVLDVWCNADGSSGSRYLDLVAVDWQLIRTSA